MSYIETTESIADQKFKDRCFRTKPFIFRDVQTEAVERISEFLVTTQFNMTLEEEQPFIGGQTLTHFIDIEKVREREIRVHQALSMLKSTHFTWCQSPIRVLQNKLRILGLDWTVFEEDPILFCIFKQRLSEKF